MNGVAIPGFSYTNELNRISSLVGAEARARSIQKQQDILRPGTLAQVAHVLLDGLAYRYQLLADGRRQITAFLLPGELCELQAELGGCADYGVAALTSCTLAEVPAGRLGDTATHSPELAKALRRQSRLEEAIARAWIVGLGRRRATERLAHLFCELRERMAATGRATENACELRIGQTELADALGITSVHVNRSMKCLRQAELIRLQGGLLTFLDRPALEQLAHFNPAYLRH